MNRPDPSFWSGRRVLVTGHTGFKGAWLALLLRRLGARVTGLALDPEPGPQLFPLLAEELDIEHKVVDLRDRERLVATVREARPSILFHLAAQALVRRSYRDPAATFAVNVGGAVNVLDAMRGLDGIAAGVVVTSDKVYRNDGAGRRFVETDPLGGSDPYSASKAAAELAVASWRASFPDELPPIATARAGNVIGGGDFGQDRLVPDIVRALEAGRPLLVRYPGAVRPWQHVLDVLMGYLLQAERIAESGRADPPALNFGPDSPEATTVADLIAAFTQALGDAPDWRAVDAPDLPEAATLALDPGLAVATLGWRPRFDRSEAIAETARWYAAWRRGDDMGKRSMRAAAEALP